MSDPKVNTTDHVADIHDPVRDARNSLEPAPDPGTMGWGNSNPPFPPRYRCLRHGIVESVVVTAGGHWCEICFEWMMRNNAVERVSRV